MKNPFGKSVPKESPYAIYKSDLLPGWTWRITKTYQTPENEKKNEYARWMTWVSSPMTYGGFDAGDTYIKSILVEAQAYIVEATDEWRKYYE